MKKPFLFLWIILAGVLLFSWIYLPALSRYQDLKTRQDGIEIQTKNLQSKLKDIREERDLLKNDVGYLEKVIREELGLVRPGEIVYKFVEEKPAPPKPAAAVPAAQKPAPAAVPVAVVPAGAAEKKIALSVPAPPVQKEQKIPEKTAVLPPVKTVPSAAPASSAAPAPPAGPVYPRQETR